MIELYELPAPLGSCLGCSPPADFSVWQRFSLSFGSSSPGPTSSKRTTPLHSRSGLPPAAFFHHHHGSAQSSWSTPPSTSQRGAVQAEVQWIAAWAVERGAGSGAVCRGSGFFLLPTHNANRLEHRGGALPRWSSGIWQCSTQLSWSRVLLNWPLLQLRALVTVGSICY